MRPSAMLSAVISLAVALPAGLALGDEGAPAPAPAAPAPTRLAPDEAAAPSSVSAQSTPTAPEPAVLALHSDELAAATRMRTGGIVVTSIGIAGAVATIAALAVVIPCPETYSNDGCGLGWQTFLAASVGGSLSTAMLAIGAPLWAVGQKRLDALSAPHLAVTPLMTSSGLSGMVANIGFTL